LTRRLRKTPPGTPPSLKASSMASEHCGTLEA
jgi:hypothetical protein